MCPCRRAGSGVRAPSACGARAVGRSSPARPWRGSSSGAPAARRLWRRIPRSCLGILLTAARGLLADEHVLAFPPPIEEAVEVALGEAISLRRVSRLPQPVLVFDQRQVRDDNS